MKISEIISQLDLFGIDIKLRYKRKDQYQTWFGGCISLLVCAIIFFQFYRLGSDFIKKKKLEILQEQEFIYPSQRYDIKQDHFNIAFGIQDKTWTNFIDESIYTITADHI